MKRKTVISALSYLSYLLIFPTLVLADPSSTHFTVKDYGFGAGGVASSSSEHFMMSGQTGGIAASQAGSTNFSLNSGLSQTLQANVPPAPTLTNPGNTYYNKLKIVLDNGNNPTDTTFAIAVSKDSFQTVQYVQADDTLGTSPVWQSYTDWGGATGFTIIGLSPNKTYQASVAARDGNFTQTGYGPAGSAATVSPSISYAINIGPTYPGIPTTPPYSISLGSLTPGNVITTPDKVWIDFATNGTSGGAIYLNDNNSGLLSNNAGHTITAVSNDLASLLEGYGAQGTDVSETTGGPMEITSPYNGASDTVGTISSDKRIIFDSSNQPVTGGRAAFVLKAKASNTAPAATDYADTLTVIVSASF